MIPIIVTTSNRYLHIIPVFTYLFNKHWSATQPVTIVGYDAPNNLPKNFTFHSMGEQTGDATNFTRDSRKFFAMQPQYFIWCMEDTFIRSADVGKIDLIYRSLEISKQKIGRFNLAHEVMKQDHYFYGTMDGMPVYANSKVSLYRLSTQPSIWNRDYALEYMQKDLNCWQFESQSDFQNDDWDVCGLSDLHAPLLHNEGVRKRNLFEYDLNGLSEEDVNYINSLPCTKK